MSDNRIIDAVLERHGRDGTRLVQILREIPNLGRKSIDELKSYLHSKGLALKERT